MKRIILTVAVIAMLVSLFVFPTSAAELPAPYVDLAYNADGTIYDAAGNSEISLVSVNGNAKVGAMEVTLDDGQVHNTWAVRQVEDFDYIEIYFEQFGSNPDAWVELVNTKGVTFEIYAAYDKFLEKTAGIMGSNKSGGMSLIFRGRDIAYDPNGASHQIMFQAGCDNVDSVTAAGGWASGKYVYVGDKELGFDNVTDTEMTEDLLGKLVHLMGVYDPIAKELRMYFNGVRVQTGPLGDSKFILGGADCSVIAVGLNYSANYESTVAITPMTTVEARVYDCPLNDEQAFAAYTKCREDVILGNNNPGGDAPVTDAPTTDAPVTDAPTTDAPVTDAPVTDAPVTDAPATDAPATDAPATDAPATDAPTTEAPKDDKGCGGVIGIGAIVAILGTAVVLKKRD